MVKKTAFALAVGFALALFGMAADNPSAAPLDKAVGYSLIAKLNRSFQSMAQSGSGGVDVVSKALSALMKDAKQARKDAKIDAVFLQRFSRILRVLYTAVLSDPDQTGILMPLIEREMGDFVLEATGETWSGSGKNSIGQLANAVAQSIIDLHIYLNTMDQRETIMKSFEEKYGVDAKKKDGGAPLP
jgi:hypothetical protein